MSRFYALLASLLLAAAAPSGAQQPPADGVAWSSLSAPQQQLLGRFQGQWDSLPPPAPAGARARRVALAVDDAGAAQQRA